MAGLLVLLIGPSGVGKTVLARLLLARHKDWVLGKSATTRERRPGEGEAFYRFVTEEKFSALEKNGEFLEWAKVHNGARYGTLCNEIIPPLEKGCVVRREIDVQGLASIRHHPHFQRPDGRYRYRAIFIAPESPEQLVAHIHKRAPMTEEELQRRLASVTQEMTFAAQCDAT
ncbi:guanylate kinase, partial [Candidatus Peregrinibacteria bacterium]|nr:guanylate kinase [Candidatus Peregrinibacteria bacterium]